MATEAEIQAEVIDRMTAVWGRPTRVAESPEAIKTALREYRMALGRFDAKTLRRAFDKVRDEWRGTSWPTISTFVQAAKELSPPSETYKENFTGTWPLKAQAAMRSSLGQQAVREGVALPFYEYVERTGEHPEPSMIRTWVARRPETFRLLQELRDHPERFFAAKNLLSVGEAMLSKEHDMQRKYGKAG